MASLQARHSRTCPLYPWSTFKVATKANGCTCGPLYHVVHRHDGKLVRDPVGHVRKTAEKALNVRKVELDRKAYRVPVDRTFAEWADEWLGSLTGKQTTRVAYQGTLEVGRKLFGARLVRDLTVTDVRLFLVELRAAHEERQAGWLEQKRRPISDATLAKHLRHLSTCLGAAVSENYASENVVRRLHPSARPKARRGEASYFTDAELARLWPELEGRALALALCRFATCTGMRFGELAALEWSDVDLLGRTVRVRRAWSQRSRIVTSPKAGEGRTVDLVPQASAVLERWLAESGGAGAEGLVFPREGPPVSTVQGRHLSDDHLRKQILFPAMKRAGIPRDGERGGSRDFHSFRHTAARLMLEAGADTLWVSRQLGHSTILLTTRTYGDWARSAEQAQAGRLAGAFPV